MNSTLLCSHIKVSSIASRNIDTVLSSITIAGALIWNIKRVYGEGEIEKIIRDFTEAKTETVPFAVGSPYPFIKLDKEVRKLYPIPKINRLSKLTKQHVNAEELYKIHRTHKLIKQLLYTTQEIIKSYSNKPIEDFMEEIGEKVTSGEYIVRKGVLYSEKNRELDDFLQENDLYRTIIEPHTAINRAHGGANRGQLFNIEKIIYHEKVGLWFPIIVREDYVEKIKEAIKLLEVFGIGGKKSLGHGTAEEKPLIDECSYDKISNRGGGHIYILSHIPMTTSVIEKYGIDVGESYYTLKTRQGITENELGLYLKNRYNVIEPGSLLKIGKSANETDIKDGIEIIGDAVETVSQEPATKTYDIGYGIGLRWGR